MFLLSPYPDLVMGSLWLRNVIHGCTEREKILGFIHHKCPPRTQSSNQVLVVCSLRDKGRPRKPLSRGKGMVKSTEAIQAVQALKRAHKYTDSEHKIDHVYNTKFSRLLKPDLLAALAELQRQNEFELALKVFELVRKEVWYKPDLLLYAEMILMVGRNKLIDKAEMLFSQLKEDGVEPDTRVCTELLCAYTESGIINKAMEVYEMMKQQSGCKPNELTFTILISSLKKVGERDLANSVRKDATEYLNDPIKFLEKSHR